MNFKLEYVGFLYINLISIVNLNQVQQMNKMRPPKKKNMNWEFKTPDVLEQDKQSQYQLYLLTKPEQLKKYFMQEVPYFWVHHRISKDRQFQIYLNQLRNQVQVKGYPYVDNMLQDLDSFGSNFKIICQIKDLQRILEYHHENKKLLSIHIFDLELKRLPNVRNKKIQVKSDNFRTFKRMLYRRNFDNNETEIFMNATRITNWDISQVNQSRLVLKTLLVSKNDQKGKEDFVKLASIVQPQLGKVFQYDGSYKIDSTPEQAIKQYTKESFYHRLVNNTLKAGKGDPLFLSYIRFPVKQLYRAIKSKYQSQKLHTQSFQCYRGGKINEKQLQYFKLNKKGFIQMQGFLSCSKSKTQMSQFIVNCVFKITVNNLERDPQQDHGFCLLDSKQLTQFIKEEQVLFNIFSVMQIKDVTKQVINKKQIDVITLEFGSLAALLYEKKNNLQNRNKHFNQICVNNYEALKPYYDSIQNQGDCFKFFNQNKLAQEFYIKMLNHLQSTQKPDKNKILSTRMNLGGVYLSLGQYSKCKDSFLKAKQIVQSEGIRMDQLKLSTIYNGIGLAFKNQGRLVEAKSNFLRTINLIQKSKNRNGMKFLSIAYNNLGGIYSEENQQSQALQYYSKALNLLQTQQNQTVANTLFNVGTIHLRREDYKLAIKSLIKSAQIYNQIFGSHKETANTYLKLGQTYLRSGSLMESNKHFNNALQMMKRLYSGFDDSYIKMKRDIQSLKIDQKKNMLKSASNSVSFSKMKDMLSFMNTQQQAYGILKGEKDKASHGLNEIMNSIQMKKVRSMTDQQPVISNSRLNHVQSNSRLNHVQSNSRFNPVQSNSRFNPVQSNSRLNHVQSNSRFNPVQSNSRLNHIQSNSRLNHVQSNIQKLRYMRGQNVLNDQNQMMSLNLKRTNQKGTQQQKINYQEIIDVKMAQFNPNDYYKNLVQGRRKKMLIF